MDSLSEMDLVWATTQGIYDPPPRSLIVALIAIHLSINHPKTNINRSKENMVSTLATLVLGFGLASASALPPLPGKGAPPPPPPAGPKGAAPPPPQGPTPPPPAPYHSISSGSVIEVTPSATSVVEPSATGNATDVASAPSAPAATCGDFTSTITENFDFASTTYEFVTTMHPTSTSTSTEYTASSTVSEDLGVSTQKSLIYNIGTSTQTFYDYVTTGVCTSTETM
jgi:hypothetical protein